MNNKYDVVIIGAGIGGLICGTYLTKAGVKTLLVEQNSKPGGYCSSFEKDGYSFDVGVHYLGGMKNILENIFKELGVWEQIQFIRFNPTDKIIMPDNIVYISTNYKDTIDQFIRNFPKEIKNINSFFKFITQKDLFRIYRKTKNFSFKKLLDEFFIDYRLKATLESLILNFGLAAKHASALTAVFLYRDYILDGGYYPKGGMQEFSNEISSIFKKYGGDIIFCKKVKEILLHDNRVKGIVLDDGKMIASSIVVSNADATQTFKYLLKNYPCKENTIIDKLSCSSPLFVLYIGINNNIRRLTSETCNIWNFNTYHIENYMSNLKRSLFAEPLPFIMISYPSSHIQNQDKTNKDTIQFFLIAPIEPRCFWENNKEFISKNIIKTAEKILPCLEKYIKVQMIATPFTFYKYTLNKNGAATGWASIVNQSRATLFPPKTSLDNLFLVGHWCTIGSGQGSIPKVILSGKKVSELVLKRINCL